MSIKNKTRVNQFGCIPPIKYYVTVKMESIYWAAINFFKSKLN